MSSSMLGGFALCKIVSVFSGKVVDVWQRGTKDGDPIVIHSYLGGDNQHWLLTPGSPYYNTFSLKSFASGLYLDGLSQQKPYSENGLQLIQRPYTGNYEQFWQFIPVNQPGDAFTIVNARTNKVLDVWMYGTEDGTPIVQHEYLGGDNQHWHLMLVFPLIEWQTRGLDNA